MFRSGLTRLMRCFTNFIAANAARTTAVAPTMSSTTAASLYRFAATATSPFSAAQKQLAEGNAAVFVLGWKLPEFPTSPHPAKILCLFNPQTEASLEFALDKTSDVLPWIRHQRRDSDSGTERKVIVFPFQGDATLEKFRFKIATEIPNLLVATDTWSIVNAMFDEQKTQIAGLSSPSSIASAYAILSQVHFQCAKEISVELKNAMLCWETLLLLHLKFGSGVTPQTGVKPPTPLDQLLRRAIKPTRIFVVHVNKKVSATVTSDSKIRVELFSVDPPQRTTISLRDMVHDNKLWALASLLSTPKTVSLIIPHHSNTPQDIMMLLRSLKCRCPCIVADLRKIFAACRMPPPKSISCSGGTEEYWAALVAATGGSPDVIKVACSDIAMANTRSNLGPLGSSLDARMKPQRESSKISLCGPGTALVGDGRLLNRVDIEITKKLDAWNRSIYENPERLAREEAEAKHYDKYLVLDFETTTNRMYKRTANPFVPDNYIVLPGFLDYKGVVTIPRKYYTCREEMRLPALDKYDVIVGHNIKFDLLYVWRHSELQKFLLRGGRIWDTMYAEYLLTGHTVRLGSQAGLDDVARSYGGSIMKLDEVKAAWAAGKNTFEIPHATLAKYLLGDLKNTELIFKHHIPRALKQRQVIIAAARMDGLLCTTEMEFNGLKIDVPLAKTQSVKLMGKSSELKRTLDASVPREIPLSVRKHFNWGSNSHLGAAFFGGTLTFETHTRKPNKKDLLPSGIQLAPPEEFIGTPDDISLPANCAFLAGYRYLSPSGRQYKLYYDAFLRGRGFRKTDTLERAFDDEDAISDGYVPLICAFKCGDPTIVLQSAAEAEKAMDTITGFAMRNPVTGDAVCSLDAQTLLKFLAAQRGPNNRRFIFLMDSCVFNFKNVVLKSLLSRIGFEEQDNSVVNCADLCALRRYADGLFDEKRAAEKAEIRRIAKEKKKKGDTKKPKAELVREEVDATLLPRMELHDDDDPAAWCAKTAAELSSLTIAALKKKHDCDLEEAREMLPVVAEKMKIAKNDHSTASITFQQYNYVLARQDEALSDKELTTRCLMRILGHTCGTAFDAFFCRSRDDAQVSVTLAGRIMLIYPDSGSQGERDYNRLQRDQVMAQFTSSETGKLQVGIDMLEFFASKGDSLSKTIDELRAMEKMLGTYYEADGAGMLSLVHEHDCAIHHELQHNKTSTGRLASANPNCQNIPKEDKSSLRELFISRFGPRGMCIEADYSQLEVITLCALSRDPHMTEDIRKKVDFHCKRVTMIRPDLSYDEVFRKAKKEKIPEFVKLRQQAKTFSFQRQYGAGVKMLSISTGLQPETVRQLIDTEKETYRGCEDFSEMVTLSVHSFDPTIQDGARNKSGDFVYKGRFPVLTGSLYVFTERDIPADILRLQQNNRRGPAISKTTNFSPTQLKNYPVQGFAGEIVQVMIGRLFRHFLANGNYGGKAVLTNTVHDCVWVDCTEDICETVANDVQNILSNARTVLNSLWPEMECEVDFPADIVAGRNMGHVMPLKQAIEEIKKGSQNSNKRKKKLDGSAGGSNLANA